MSIRSALSSAQSGLVASARGAEVVASNIANARTEAYGRRVLNLSARVLGGTGQGVSVDSVQRLVDLALIADRRLAAADADEADLRAGYLRRVENAIGNADNTGSLVARVATLDAALVAATGRPDAVVRLQEVATAATDLSRHIREASAEIQAARGEADRDIAAQVDFLNTALTQIDALNDQISKMTLTRRDPSALLDQRQRLVDQVAVIIPLRSYPRDNGAIALYTVRGGTLVDGAASVFGFAPVGVIVPEMTLGSGALSGLTLNGRPVETGGAGNAIAGGRLSALFEIRDNLAPAAQARLDVIARDLVERFSDSSVDPTLPTGAPGLFTDAGAAFDPLVEIGISARIAVNPVVLPEAGGDLWRLRSGLGAAVPGDVGSSVRLSALSGAMQGLRTIPAGDFFSGARSAAQLAGDLVSRSAADRLSAENRASFTAARHETLRLAELSDGVDTDQELQNLLRIETAYGANARVIQVVSQMMQTILEI